MSRDSGVGIPFFWIIVGLWAIGAFDSDDETKSPTEAQTTEQNSSPTDVALTIWGATDTIPKAGWNEVEAFIVSLDRMGYEITHDFLLDSLQDLVPVPYSVSKLIDSGFFEIHEVYLNGAYQEVYKFTTKSQYIIDNSYEYGEINAESNDTR